MIKKKQKQQPPHDKAKELEKIVVKEHQINTRSKGISQCNEANAKKETTT